MLVGRSSQLAHGGADCRVMWVSVLVAGYCEDDARIVQKVACGGFHDIVFHTNQSIRK
jgi:hypothetical protein